MRRQCMRPRLRLLGEFVGCFQDKVRYGPSLPWKRSCNLSQEDQYAPPPVGELFWPGCFCTSDCKLQHLCQSIFFIYFLHPHRSSRIIDSGVALIETDRICVLDVCDWIAFVCRDHFRACWIPWQWFGQKCHFKHQSKD